MFLNHYIHGPFYLYKVFLELCTPAFSRLAMVGILGKEKEPGVGKLGWHGNFDTGIWKEYFIQNEWVFLNI